MIDIDESMELEQAMQALQEAVDALEDPQMKLEERIGMYEQASRLALLCQKKLSQAKLRIIDINERLAEQRKAGD